MKSVFVLLLIIGIFGMITKTAFAQFSSQASKTTKIGNPPASALGSFVFYCQGDPKFDDKAACGLGQAGCGPTSLAMIFSSFGFQITPNQMITNFKQKGFWTGCASYMEAALKSQWLKDQGFTVAPICSGCGRISVESLRKYFSEGYLLVGSSQSFPCVSCRSAKFIDHIFVADGINEADGTISIRDPNNCSYADGKEIQANVSRNKINGSFPWYYAYAVKRLNGSTPTQSETGN